jgi:hypothetical protein
MESPMSYGIYPPVAVGTVTVLADADAIPAVAATAIGAAPVAPCAVGLAPIPAEAVPNVTSGCVEPDAVLTCAAWVMTAVPVIGLATPPDAVAVWFACARAKVPV